MKDKLRLLARRYLSRETRHQLARLAVWPPVGWVRFGDLRRLKPISSDYGNSRGLEIDRYYIEKFLAEYAGDIHDRVLEIKHNTYTKKYGQNRVTKSDVLHPVEGNPDATMVADLTKADHVPSDCYDAIIFTQTLQVIYDFRTVIATLYRILKPGGVLLATVSGMAQISLDDFDEWGEYWRFTSLSARLLFEEAFSVGNVTVHPYGNVLAAISFLEGLACEDLERSELDSRDRRYEVLIAVRASKPEQTR
ncbi:MAG TPA: methyltransferase domain-containing protein [Anaerolineales bacterium]|nr:methyltransferase domain-containing protein [Anaerolineales bacterium]